MNTILRYTLITALRDWLFIGLSFAAIATYGFSVFTGYTALVEQAQMTMAYFAGTSRVVLNIGLVVFVCFHVRRMFDNREVESILSKPLSRTRFVIAYWFGFAILSFISTIPVLIILAVFNQPNFIGLIYWGISLWLELSLIIAFALLTSLIMRSAVACVLSTFAFYLISRLMGFFVAAMYSEVSLFGHGFMGNIMVYILKIISTIIPRLDLFAKSQWLIYGIEKQPDLWVFPIQSIVFTALLLVMSIFDFKRRQF